MKHIYTYTCTLTGQEYCDRLNTVSTMIIPMLAGGQVDVLMSMFGEIDSVDAEVISEFKEQAIRYYEIMGEDKTYEDVMHDPEIVEFIKRLNILKDYLYPVKEVE